MAWSDSSAGISYIDTPTALDLNGADLTVAVGGFATQGLQLNTIQSGGTGAPRLARSSRPARVHSC